MLPCNIEGRTAAEKCLRRHSLTYACWKVTSSDGIHGGKGFKVLIPGPY